jgi:uncharacterized iron-regulated membrane protein
MPTEDGASRPTTTASSVEQPPAPDRTPPTAAERNDDASRSWWSALRPLVLRLHFYAGILIAPFLLVTAGTGLLYVATPQLEQYFYAHELHVPASATVQPLDAQVAAARAVHPGDSLKSVRPAPSSTDTTQAIFDAPDLPESFHRTVFIDPHTSAVRGALDTYGGGQALPLRAWIDNLHRGLHLGDPGRLYSELAASWLWVVVLGGVLLWWGRKQNDRRSGTDPVSPQRTGVLNARYWRSLFVPQLRPAGRRRILSWHGSVGLAAAVGLLFLSATGLTWSTYAGENIGQLREALSWETPEVSTELAPSPGSPPPRDVGFDRVWRAASDHHVTGPVEITPPEKAGEAYTVQQTQRHWPTRQDSAAVDPATGQVTATLRFADYPLAAKLSRWGIDAHMGVLFGWVNQLLLAALASGLICTIFWGYRMWWLRRPTRDRTAFGEPPGRGAWRRVPGKVLAPLILVTAFLGYFVPLFGASLLLFLVLDVALGFRARHRTADRRTIGA